MIALVVFGANIAVVLYLSRQSRSVLSCILIVYDTLLLVLQLLATTLFCLDIPIHTQRQQLDSYEFTD
jgi:hypothetical protein